MPKALSLNKAKNLQPRNQIPITQFFKKSNDPATQNVQHSPSKFEESTSTPQKISVKRKAPSPLKSIKNTTCTKDNKYVMMNSSKKFKNTDMTQNFFTDTELHSKISPEKENGFNKKQSPKEVNINMHIMQEDVNKIVEIDLPKNGKKSPLTPLNADNIIKNDEEKLNGCDNNHKLNYIENHVYSSKEIESLRKDSSLGNHDINYTFTSKRIETPKKNPEASKELYHSPRIEKVPQHSPKNKSPTKCTSIKNLEFSQYEIDDMDFDMWEDNKVGKVMDRECVEDLDLSMIQRCEVVSVQKHPSKLELKLKNAHNKRGTCFVEGIWLDTPLNPGEVVSVIANKDSSKQFSVSNTSGLLILHPDYLISTTSVVAGVFCKRKAVLQERWRGIDPANIAMTIGILTHELVQKALTEKIMSVEQLRLETSNIINESIERLYDAGLSEDEAHSSMQVYISPLAEFMQTYVGDKPPPAMQTKKDNWCGHIDKILDIEENLCCPQLGLKGKIDATLEVTIYGNKGRQHAVVPLELKSGKASVSAEHRGQLVQYGMMLSLQQNKDPTRDLQRGLLLYLKDRIDLREISCGYPERRDLMMLRNQLVQHLAAGLADPEQLSDIEEASHLLRQRLPEPVSHETACAKCPYLTLCSLHLWHTECSTVSNKHPLSRLRNEALGHLTKEHIKYFLHWTALIKLEEQMQGKTSPLHALWTESVEKRSQRGVCAANLRLISVKQSGDRFLHTFERQIEDIVAENSKSIRGPQEGEFSIVSIDNRPWIAAGFITRANEREIHIILERDLRRRLNNETSYHIDNYESASTTINNLANIGVLMDDNENARRLRRIIIDKDTPQFDKKLPREVSRLGTKLMRSLNIEQQRAVLKALAAKDYALIQGLPGTGKTQTISILIQMLVGLKKRVLVTAHTHSAVDTVLRRLPESIRVMRLGSSARVASCLTERCEQHLTAKCETPQQLAEIYNSMEVVGVTCLGSGHAMLSKTIFDVCIVDEATQVLQSTVLRPLYASKRFVLVGDPEQLPPVVKSRAARRLGMEVSLFHRLANEDATYTLQLQYRMNQKLTDVANKVAYKSRLKCANQEVAQARLNLNMEVISRLYVTEAPWLLKACSPEPEYAAIFLDMELINDNKDEMCTNVDEACIVLEVVNALKEGGIKPTDIGIIAPYRDQVSLLRRHLVHQSIEVSTVDQFQGRDKSVIIYSCTRSDDGKCDKKIKENEILNDQRRMAVSVTRAKHKLLSVGNSRALQRYAPMKQLIDACVLVPLEKNAIQSSLFKYRTLIS